MAMPDLVAGGAACAVPGSSSASNPLGALANVLIGSSSKTQKRLKEIPTSTFLGSSSYTNSETQLATLPGLESDYQLNQHSSGQDSAFLHGFCTAGHGDLAQAWNEIHTIQIPDWQHLQIESNFPQSSHIYNYLLPSQPQVLDAECSASL